MAKQHFFARLIPPRPTFVQDMTGEERALMGQHTLYTRDFFERGKVLVYGPVLAAGGPFGAAVLEVENEAEARGILDNDPTVTAGLNKYELSPMRLGGARSSALVA
jgi:uncharacterized protein YciI